MRRPVALLVGPALLTCLSALEGQPTGEQILEKVCATYQNLRSFRFVQKGLEVAEALPGRVRVREGRALLVSNGESTWTYLPHLNQYTETAAAPLLEETWRSPDWVHSALLSWMLHRFLDERSDLPREKGDARLQGQKRLKVGGKPTDCYVVSLVTRSGSHKLWVDRATSVIWRVDWFSGPPDQYDLGNFLYGGGGSTLLDANLGAVPGADFEFVAPRGAVRVDHCSPQDAAGEPWDPDIAYFMPSVDALAWKYAPDFTLQDPAGKEVRLNDLRGRLVVLEFWTSWCRPCQKELAEVQKLHEDFGQGDVVFVGINAENSETARASAKASGYTFLTLLDPKGIVHQLYGVRWAPTTVVADRGGKIVARYVGARGEAGLRKALEAAGLSAGAATKRR